MQKNKQNSIPKRSRRYAKRKQVSQARNTAREYLSESETLAPRLQRLAQAIVGAKPRRALLTHQDAQEMLGFYVERENRGENARDLYHDVYDHLMSCDDCRASYELLKSARPRGDTTSLSSLTKPKIDLPFLVQSSPDAAWSKQVRSPIGGGPLGFVLKIKPSHLANVLARAPQFAGRGEASAERSLLLLDSIALGSREVQVELWLHRAASPDHARLEISIVSSSPLPEPLRVKLSWNEHQYSSAVEQGRGWIDPIPISGLENARISVEVEAGQPTPSTER
ncbi:MAG: hypothetical protein M1482_12560 [Chloroflexi bacterium]|nr:hypothetical protein [Chloroflexota bacterium]